MKIEERILEHYEQMYRLAYTYVRNEQDAMDVVQESVYKAIKNSHKVKKEEYMKTWLWRIVMNTAVDFIRKNQKEVYVEEMPVSSVEDTYKDFDTLEALAVLDEKERAVIMLRFFEDQKISEVAQAMEENVNTVKTILYRSLKKLKIKLEEGEMLYEQ